MYCASGVLTMCVTHCFVCHRLYLHQINEASHYRNNDCFTIKTITRYFIHINTQNNTVQCACVFLSFTHVLKTIVHFERIVCVENTVRISVCEIDSKYFSTEFQIFLPSYPDDWIPISWRGQGAS